MPDAFQYNIFLSHSSKDKAVVRTSSLSASTGERAGVRCRSLDSLRADDLKVWFDEWVLKPVVPLAHQMGEGARRAGEGCISAHAFGSDWAQLESGKLKTGQRPFRNPLNKEHRFLPLRGETNVRWQFPGQLCYSTQIPVALVEKLGIAGHHGNN